MLVGVPMAKAMGPTNEIMRSAQPANSVSTMMDVGGYAQRPACCVNVRSQHEVKAEASNEQVKSRALIVANLSSSAFHFSRDFSSSVVVPPDRPKFLQIPIVGMTIKRE